MKTIYFSLFLIICPFFLHSNEMINSNYDNYYEYLELTGDIESPVIFFHSLSNNDWGEVEGDHPWMKFMDSDRSVYKNDYFSINVYDPDLFLSVNSYLPSGFNDGAIWQGSGLNGRFRAGFNFDSKYFEATFYPEIWFAQNLIFTYLQATPEFGYFQGGLDYPQRFGDSAFMKFSWGQTDIRFKYETFSAGFSTENIWIGPGEQNALILSNNAEGFPHFDIGIRKTPTLIGFIEARYFLGLLTESDYYNDNPNDDYRLYHGMSVSYTPPFIPGLSLGANWVINTVGGSFELGDFLPYFVTIFGEVGNMGGDATDQKISLMAEWKFPEVGFSSYAEWAREDYTASLNGILFTPGHTEFYTLGLKKTIPLNKQRGFILTAELSELIESRDYEIGLGAGSNYYTHTKVKHGYTNQGQILGASIGPGSDSQYISLDYYDKWGSVSMYFRRVNYDKMYLYKDPVDKHDVIADPSLIIGANRLNVEVTPGIKADLFLGNFNLYTDISLSFVFNHLYIPANNFVNFYMNLGCKYRF